MAENPWRVEVGRSVVDNQRNQAMKKFVRRPVLYVFTLLCMAVVALTAIAPATAGNGCGLGWYWNNVAAACQPNSGGVNVSGCISATGRRGHVTGGVCINN
jgi:hypothetical protein